MRTEFPVKPLGDLCDPERGITYGIVKVGEFVPNGVPVIRGGDIRDGRIVFNNAKRVTQEISNGFRRTILRGGEILINLISEPGHTALVPKEFVGANVSRDVGVIALNDTVDHRFVNYYLQSSEAVRWLDVRLQGSVTQKINLSTLRELPIPIPPCADQRAIAGVLGALDDKIQLNRRVTETLDALARAFFRDWFVDFGPTRAKLAGHKPYLAPDVWTLFPDRLDDEGKPEGWRSTQLGRHFRLERGLSYKGEFLTEHGKPMVNLGCFLGNGRFNPDKLKNYSGEYRGRHTVQVGDLVIANTDMTQQRVVLGSPHIIEAEDGCEEFLYSHHVYAARPLTSNDKRWLRFYYYHLLLPQFRERAEGFATGTTVLFLPHDAAEKLTFVEPAEAVYDAFLQVVSPLIERGVTLRREAKTLTAARELLLPKFMSGEIRVPDAEKIAEAVA